MGLSLRWGRKDVSRKEGVQEPLHQAERPQGAGEEMAVFSEGRSKESGAAN